MPKYSPVAPIGILEQLYIDGLLGGYLLFLAHDVLKHPQQYCDLVSDLKMKYEDELFIIMDNGVIENGKPVSIGAILEASNLVEASCIVGPDVVGDLAGTKKLMMDRDVALIRRDFDMMFVPQGKDITEVCDCIKWMAEKFPSPMEHRYWGIPRWIANEIGSRAGPINYINTYYENSKIHLLGMSHYLMDDVTSTKTRNVMGIDSANPLVMGYNNRRINSVGWPVHMERGTYWDSCVHLNTMMRYNVDWVHGIISGS